MGGAVSVRPFPPRCDGGSRLSCSGIAHKLVELISGNVNELTHWVLAAYPMMIDEQVERLMKVVEIGVGPEDA